MNELGLDSAERLFQLNNSKREVSKKMSSGNGKLIVTVVCEYKRRSSLRTNRNFSIVKHLILIQFSVWLVQRPSAFNSLSPTRRLLTDISFTISINKKLNSTKN